MATLRQHGKALIVTVGLIAAVGSGAWALMRLIEFLGSLPVVALAWAGAGVAILAVYLIALAETKEK